MTRASTRMRRTLRLARDDRGVALIEFAFTLPILLTIGMYGAEIANLALVNLKVSQIALAAADNASRVGASSKLAEKQLRESDIDDILQAIRIQGKPLDLTTRGRITLSSLERNSSDGQWIHWQRCIGTKSGTGYDSSYGKTDDGKTGTAFKGMGPTGKEVTAPAGAAVMFVEINYDYRPIVGTWAVGARTLSYTASFVVRDKRDLTGTGISGTTSSAQTCDKYAA